MNVSYIFTAIILIVSLVMQGHSSFDVLRIGGVKPDIAFIAVIYYSYSFGSFYGEVTALVSGFFHDSMSNAPLGLLTLPKVIVAFAVGLMGRAVMKTNILTIIPLVFGASVLKGVISLLLCMIFHEAGFADIAYIILPESFYNALLAIPLFLVFDKIYENELGREGNY
ncbi:MAG: rod shape-determining protein MreD [Spirochaetes bacterium]|jgi:rod shape-determining protein MreD|nr:rod shape-determining protein MreD [Spirochaetota bacterium]